MTIGAAADALSLVGGALTIATTTGTAQGSLTELLGQASSGAADGGQLVLRAGDAAGAGAGGMLSAGVVSVGRTSSAVKVHNGIFVGSVEGGSIADGPADLPLTAGAALGVILGSMGGGNATVAGKLVAQSDAIFE
ncbi:hypothetical protein T492DRAFT_858570, partial [Pavlovales sp. CCMP2436]